MTTPSGSPTVSSAETKFRKRKRPHDQVDENVKESAIESTEMTEAKEKKKKLKIKPTMSQDRNGERAPDAKNNVSEKEGIEDKKKEKKSRSKSSISQEATDILASKKRRRKEKTSKSDDTSSRFPNPNELSTLSDQARKALNYAYDRLHLRPDWKFNKARQNWLLRNFWSDKTAIQIPDIFVPLAIAYLVDMKGKSRESLIEQSRELLKSLPSEISLTTGSSLAKATSADEPAPSSQTDAEISRNNAQPATDKVSESQKKAERAELVLQALKVLC